MLSEDHRSTLYSFNPSINLSLSSLDSLKEDLVHMSVAEIERELKANSSSPEYHKKDIVSSGTTVIAFEYRNGVVMAADRQTTHYGRYRGNSRTVKVHPLDPLSLWGAAGGVAYIQELKDVFFKTLKHFRSLIGRNIYIDGQARLLAKIMRHNYIQMGIAGRLLGMIAHPILAGWDPDFNGIQIYNYGTAGSMTHAHPSKNFGVVGSGSNFATTTLNEHWGPDLDEFSAISLAVRTILRAAEIDLFTSDPRHYPTTVLVVHRGEDGQGGRKHLDSEDAVKIARAIDMNDIERRRDNVIHNVTGGEDSGMTFDPEGGEV